MGGGKLLFSVIILQLVLEQHGMFLVLLVQAVYGFLIDQVQTMVQRSMGVEWRLLTMQVHQVMPTDMLLYGVLFPVVDGIQH